MIGDTTMTLNAGVIGCGNISKYHFAGLEKAGANITWVCDLAEEAARPWADRFGASYTKDYKDILQDGDVNIVVVTPVSSVHKMMCCDAIDAGKAVICEKTLAENADDALEIVTLAEEKNTIFYTSYMKRFIPAVEKAKELLPSLGRIVSTSIRAYQGWGSSWDTTPTEGFFYTPPGGKSDLVKNYGGGILVCGGSHILDLVMFFLGRPKRLYAYMHYPEGQDYDLQAAALLETENGVVHYEALAHTMRRVGFLNDGWDEQMEINGMNGRLVINSAAWDQFENKSSMLIHYDNDADEPTKYYFEPASPFERAVAFFCRNIENGVQGDQSRMTGYEVDELISHIKLSASRKSAVDVNWRVPAQP